MTKHILPKFIKLSFKICKGYYFALIFKTIMSTLTVLLSAYTISLIIGFIEANDVNNAIKYSLIVVLLEVILALLNYIANYFYNRYGDVMKEKVQMTLADKIMKLPFEYLEDPYYIELKKDSEQGINNMGALYSMIDSLQKVISSVITIIGLSIIIITFDPILVIVLICGIILNIILVLLSYKTQMKFYKDLLPMNYKYNYYLSVGTQVESAKDFRLFPIYNLITDKFQLFCKEMDKYFVKIECKDAIYNSLISIIKYIQMAFIYTFVAIRTITRNLTISSFSLTVSSAIEFSSAVTNIIDASSNLIRATMYVKPMIELMEIKEENNGKIKDIKSIDSIRFENVTFSYPNTNKIVLDNVSFEIKAKEKISIIGLNGAGKTTIVKLICRLYKPNSGTIYINNIPIDEYDFDSYINLVSTVFQDFKLFSYSIKENIKPGISENEAKKICCDINIANKIEELENKYDSVLYKTYDENNVELSGGQYQKIAIARALAKNASFLILDEPTSALDPLAEADIYQNFNELTAGKTAIYISHRMSSSVFCDKVLVLDGGKVVSFASHSELMKDENSLYYQMFMAQAKNYVN